MKRAISILLVVAMLLSLCACGSTSTNSSTTNNDTAAPTEDKNIIEEIFDIKSDDDPVDIYHSIMDFEGIGAEAYLENLKQENPENQYRYYNEQYYIQTITEGERKAVLEQVTDVDAFFSEAFATDYPGMFIKAELNKNMNELTLHLNRDVYDSNLFAGFAILIVGGAYVDSLQAYNLVSPEKRDGRLVCVDENGEILIDSDSLESSTDEPAADSTIANAAYTLNEYVVVDNENCTFIIKSIDPRGDWGFTLNVFCENKTDKKLSFTWDKVSVMGCMIDPFWGTEIAAGKKSNESISFYYEALDAVGMESVDEITFTLRVSDSDDWSADPILVEEYAIYPTGKSIQDISYPVRKTSSNEVVLYDTDQFSVIVLSNETDGNDFIMHCYLENKTGHEIMFSMDDVSVNGYMADPFWGTSVAAGKKLYTTVCFYEYLLSDNGISNVEEIEFTLRVSNADTWDTHASEVFTYTP